MNEYRNSAREVAREARWSFFRFLPIVVGVLVVLAGVGFGLRSIGLLGGTIVERKVFEQSYQRSEALAAQIATDEAVIVEITGKLSNPNLDENTRYNLKAQVSAAKVRIATTRSKQK